MIEWNDGLNIGVTSLDDDHKELLHIINNLSEAIDTNETKDVLENIFNELQNRTQDHFSREEIYLDDCNCTNLKEHAGKHRAFCSKLLELKTKVLSSKDYVATQDITIYLVV